MTNILQTILKSSNYQLTQFTKEQISKLEKSIILKDSKGVETPYISCLVRKKDIRLTPEEIVRQLYIMKLQEEYDYPIKRMQIEYSVSFGHEKKRADIVIFDKKDNTTPYIIIEIKKPNLKDGKEQLKSYCHGTGATMAIWTNGDSISYYHRKDPNYFEDIV
tara:strand:+ start:80 stop:565 length:486 start_codon:yes stop_codon:yes gene_type:complete